MFYYLWPCVVVPWVSAYAFEGGKPARLIRRAIRHGPSSLKPHHVIAGEAPRSGKRSSKSPTRFQSYVDLPLGSSKWDWPSPSWENTDVDIGAPDRNAPVVVGNARLLKKTISSGIDPPIAYNRVVDLGGSLHSACQSANEDAGELFAWLSGPALHSLTINCSQGSLQWVGSMIEPGLYSVHLMHERSNGNCNYQESAELPLAFAVESKDVDLFAVVLQRTQDICTNVGSPGRWINRDYICKTSSAHPLCKHPDVEGLQWVPQNCYYKYHAPHDAKSLLNGREMLLLGDSVMRFIFGALVRLIDPDHAFIQSGYGSWKSPNMHWLYRSGSQFDPDYRNFPFAFRDEDQGTNLVYAFPPDGITTSLTVPGPKQDFVWNSSINFLWKKPSFNLVVFEFPLVAVICSHYSDVDYERQMKDALDRVLSFLEAIKGTCPRVIAVIPHQHSCIRHCSTNARLKRTRNVVVPELVARGIEVLDTFSVTSPLYFNHPVSQGIHPHSSVNDLFAQMLLHAFA